MNHFKAHRILYIMGIICMFIGVLMQDIMGVVISGVLIIHSEIGMISSEDCEE